MSHARPLVGALVAAALLTAGCGSSSKDEPAKPAKAAAAAPAAPSAAVEPAQTGPVPTRAVYVQRADRVCRQARGVSQRANELVQKAFASQDSAGAADAIDHYMPLFSQHVAELKALRQPTGDQKILRGLIKVMDAQVQALIQESKALRDQDSVQLQQIGASQQQSLAFAEELAKQYGFRVCGRGA
jgi:hypothetical protein